MTSRAPGRPTFLVVGEAPPPSRSPDRDLASDLALRCARPPRNLRGRALHWLCVNRPLLFEFALRSTSVNLLREWPGRGHSKGSAFPQAEAARAAADLLRKVRAGHGRVNGADVPRAPDAVILAGRRVARAFWLQRKTPFFSLPSAGPPLYVLPHPSGVNPWYNSSRNRAKARHFLERLVRNEL